MIKLQLQPPDSADEQHPGIDRKRQAPADLPEPQAKVQALSARLALDWDSPKDHAGAGLLLDWRPEGRDGARLAIDPAQRLVAPNLLPAARFGPRRGGSGGRMRGGSRATATGRGCAKLVRTTTRLYIGVGNVREWLGEVGARTELQVKVMLDGRMLNGVHQADLLYNKGAHYYWITSRTLKRTAMGKWFLGWNHTPADGLVLLLRSPSKDEIAAAIAEGFQGKEEDEDTEMSEQQQQLQQQQMLHAMSPTSPHPGRLHTSRSVTAFTYGDEDALMLLQQQHMSEMEDLGDGGHYQRGTPLSGPARIGGTAGDEDDAVSGLSGDSDLRRALGPSDPRLMVALAAAELQRGMYPGSAPGSASFGRRSTPGPGTGAAAGPARGQGGGRDLQQSLPGGRPLSGPGPALGGGQARAVSDGLNTPGSAGASPGQQRTPVAQSARFTNFSEVPGGTAFANVSLSSEQLGLEPQAPPLQLLQQQRGGAAAIQPQLGATAGIASNLSLAGATQLTGPANMAPGVAGPIAAPLRLPTNVSELLPPEYLPAAVSVRCTLNGNLQPDIFACEIHRNRQGHCYLYNLPPTVLEGRSQQDWMISEDGCLVLCLKAAQQPSALQENKAVRSNPAYPQAGTQAAPGNGNADAAGARGGTPARTSAEKPVFRSHRKSLDNDIAPAQVKQQQPEPLGIPGVDLDPKAPGQREQQPGQEEEAAATAATATEPAFVTAALPVAERHLDARRERPPQLTVPRQAIESLYGNVLLPHPVLLRYQIDGDPEQQVYLAEVADAGSGELYLRGASLEPLVGRTLTGWRRSSVLSHQLLVVCLDTLPDAAGQVKAGARAGRDEEPRRARNEQAPSPGLQQPAGRQSPQHQHQPPGSSNWGAFGEAQLGGSRPPVNPVAFNPFGQHQPSLSAVTVAPPPSRPSAPQVQQAAWAAGGGGPYRHSPPQLQPVMSGLLPGVGSNMLPPSLSLMNNGSNSLLPAQASNLPFTSSAPRPEGNASIAVGGAGGARPASANARDNGAGAQAAGGEAPGQRSPSLNVEGGGSGGGLQTVASLTQASAQGPGPRQDDASRANHAAPVFPWEGAAAGQAAATVFAFGLGLGQEPSSPKGAVELSASGKRSSQPQGLAAQQGRGGGSVLQSAPAAESALQPRNTAQTAGFSSANAASHVRGAQGSYPLPVEQHLLHPGNPRVDDESELELRRSPGRRGSGGAAAGTGPGSGDNDTAASNRGGRQQTDGAASEHEGAVLSAPVTGGQGESGPTMRHLPTQGALAAEPAGPSLQDAAQHPQQSRARTDRSQSHSWRFDVQQHEVQRAEQPPPGTRAGTGAGGDNREVPEAQSSLTYLPAGGHGREGGRWVDALTQGPSARAEDARTNHVSRYAGEPFPARSASEGRLGHVASAENPRAAAEAAEPRPPPGFGSTGHQARRQDAHIPSGRALGPEADGRGGDLEMKDSGPGASPTLLPPGRTEAPQPGPGGTGADKQQSQAASHLCAHMDVDMQDTAHIAQQHSQPAQQRHRRMDLGGGHGTFEAQGQAGAEPSRQGIGSAAAASDHSKLHQHQHNHTQQQQPLWFPRLDLAGATVSGQEDGAGRKSDAASVGEEGSRPARSEGEGDKPPPRRQVLRMLSAVAREPDDDVPLQRLQPEDRQRHS